MRTITVVWFVCWLTACVSVPDVYIIDRHTVMESEASGEWPDLEKRFQEESISKGPVNLAEDPSDTRQKRVFNVLNSEYSVRSEGNP